MELGLKIDPVKDRHYGRWFVLFLLACLLVSAGWYGYQWYTTGLQPPIDIPIAKANPAIDESRPSQTQVDTHEVAPDQPRYIAIPSLDIKKTRVFAMGLTEQNLFALPNNLHDAAWYNKSATPGKGYGTVLINAHNEGIGKDSVFSKLSKLSKGDKITLERGDGQMYTYSVKDMETIQLEELNKEGMKPLMQSASATDEGLNLATYAGKWIPQLQQFDQRLIVRAVSLKE